MSCGLGLSFFPNQFKSPTGLMRAGCPIRLKELNNASKVSPTKLQGSQVARENYIRRRVATIVQVQDCLPGGDDPKVNKRFKGEECNEYYAYGPVFGIAKGPRYGGRDGLSCKSGGCMKIYYANGGSGSDVTKWKRLYGGSRVLFSTSNCKYGCCSVVGKEGLTPSGCYCWTFKLDSTVILQKGDVLWPLYSNSNTPPVDVFDARVIEITNAATNKGGYQVRCKDTYSYMSNFFRKDKHTGQIPDVTDQPLTILRQDKLNNWHTVGVVTRWGTYAEGQGPTGTAGPTTGPC